MTLHKDDNEDLRKVWNTRKNCLRKEERAGNRHISQGGKKTSVWRNILIAEKYPHNTGTAVYRNRVRDRK